MTLIAAAIAVADRWPAAGYWINRAPPAVVTCETARLRGLSLVTFMVALPCTQICPATRAMLGELRFTVVLPNTQKFWLGKYAIPSHVALDWSPVFPLPPIDTQAPRP